MALKKTDTKKKAKEAKPTKFTYFVYVLVFVIVWFPLVLPRLGTVGPIEHDFSTYNTNWNGASDFRDDVEAMGYETRILISSLSSVGKLEEPGVLVILGPTIFYSILDTTAIFGFILDGGSVLIADDFGSANTLFDPINNMLSQAGFQISFTTGVLHDFGSYMKNPVLPLITSIGSHPTTDGVSSLLLNYAAAINISYSSTGGGMSAQGIPLGLLAFSTEFSWVDIDYDNAPDPENETAGPFPVALAFDFAPLGQFLGLNSTAGKLVMVSDPSLFINEMLPYADNQLFASNVIEWLANYNTSKMVVFDEGHHEWGLRSAVSYYGLVLSQINSISANWILAPLAPLSLYYLVKRWLPKARKPEELTPSEVFRVKGKTRYSMMLDQYKKYTYYNAPLKPLYRKWKREFVDTLKLDGWPGVKSLLKIIKSRRGDIKVKRLGKQLRTCEKVNDEKTRVQKDEFMSIFLGIRDTLSKLKGGEYG